MIRLTMMVRRVTIWILRAALPHILQSAVNERQHVPTRLVIPHHPVIVTSRNEDR